MEKRNDESLEWTLIRKSLAEGLTKEEQEQLNAWLEASPEHRAFYNRISKFDRSEGIAGLSGKRINVTGTGTWINFGRISGKTVNDVWYISLATRRCLSCCWVWGCISGTRTVRGR